MTRQRPWPERIDEPRSDRREGRRESLGAGAIGDVDDQRMSGRTSLQRKDLGDGFVAIGTRAEPVHRLGRKRDQLAGGDQRDGLVDRRGVVAVEAHR